MSDPNRRFCVLDRAQIHTQTMKQFKLSKKILKRQKKGKPSWTPSQPASWYREQSLKYNSGAIKEEPNPPFTTYEEYLKSPQWRATRLRLFAIRGRKCERCASKYRIEVHHLTYTRIGQERPSDLQILCHACHQKTHA